MQQCEIATEFTISMEFTIRVTSLVLFDGEAPLIRGPYCHHEWFGLRAAGQRVITSKPLSIPTLQLIDVRCLLKPS